MSAHVTRRKADHTGRSTGRFADTRFRKMNSPPPGEPFIWITKAMLASHAWRALSGPGIKVVMRIVLEHLAHGGAENGRLPVTFDDFVKAGVGRNSIAPALAQAAALGFIRRTGRGTPARHGVGGSPATYGLTWLPHHDGARPTNDWKTFASRAQARAAAALVRNSVNQVRGKAAAGDHNTPDTAQAARQRNTSSARRAVSFGD